MKKKKKKRQNHQKGKCYLVTSSSGHTIQEWLWNPVDLLGQQRVFVGPAEDEVNIECTGWNAGHTTKTPTDFNVAKISLFRAIKGSSSYLHLWIYRFNVQDESGHQETIKYLIVGFFLLKEELYKNKYLKMPIKIESLFSVKCKLRW